MPRTIESLTPTVEPTKVTSEPRRREGIFAPGEIVAERFRIVRLLGQGGMGQVFEAYDLELATPVALKAIRPEQSRDPRANQAFKREVHLARQVTHATVCRIFDLFQHRSEATWGRPRRPVLFLTMELLVGESLSERLKRSGRLSPAEVLPLARDMAEALDAAHRAGIVHQDFKSSNVMLVEGSQGPRAIVTDFGLARALERSGPPADGDEVPGGTPGYMAPEMARGEKATAACDVYSFGVVLFEMMNGYRPFSSRGPREAPSHRARFRPEISSRWEAVVRRCLATDPVRRFPSAGGACSALARARASGRRFLVRIAAATLLAAGVAGAASVFRPPAGDPSRAPAPAAEARPSVSVFGFRNLSPEGEEEWLSTALVEMLDAELAAGNALRILPGEAVASMKLELGLAETETLTAGALHRVRRYLGADFVVLGSYVLLKAGAKSRIQLNVGLQDAETSETLTKFTLRGSRDRLFDLVQEAGSRLRDDLGVLPATASESTSGQAALPSSPEAARSYARGLARLRERNFSEARELLETTARLEPGSARVHSALAACWIGLGYDQQAAAAARRALDLAMALDRRQQLEIEGLHAETIYDWPRAGRVYTSLATVFPDDPDYGLRLATVQTAGGHPEEAYTTLDELRVRFGDDPRFNLAEAEAARARADLERQRRAAERASSVFRALGAELLLARSGLLEAEALRRLGLSEEAAAKMKEVRRIYDGRGDRRSLAEALIRRRHASDAEQKDLEEALDFFRGVGDKQGVALALIRLSSIVMWDSTGEAETLLEEALELARELGNRGIEAEALNRLGQCAFMAAGADRSLDLFARASASARQSGDLSLLAGILSNYGGHLGSYLRLAEAEEVLDEALALSRNTGSLLVLGFSLSKLAYVYRLTARLDASEALCGEIAGVAERLGDENIAKLGFLCSGEVHLLRGNYGEAFRMSIQTDGGDSSLRDGSAVSLRVRALIYQGLFREAEERLRQMEDLMTSGGYLSLLVEVLLELGRVAEAREILPTLESQEVQVRLNQMQRARVVALLPGSSGSVQEALGELEDLAAEAAGLGYRTYELEVRLAQGRFELSGGDPSVGQARLEELAREAGELGLGDIVKRVERILGAAQAIR